MSHNGHCQGSIKSRIDCLFLPHKPEAIEVLDSFETGLLCCLSALHDKAEASLAACKCKEYQ